MPPIKESFENDPSFTQLVIALMADITPKGELGLSFYAQGPAVIEDEGCTVFVSPDCGVSVEQNGCLKIEVG